MSFATETNYEQLSEACLRQVLAFFQVKAQEQEIVEMAKALQFYSKDPTGTRRHTESDSAEKQEKAGEAIRLLAEKWAMNPYQVLEQAKLSI